MDVITLLIHPPITEIEDEIQANILGDLLQGF